MLEYSFGSCNSEDEVDLAIAPTVTSDEEGEIYMETAIVESVNKKKQFKWTESKWENLSDVEAFLAAEDFRRYDIKYLDMGVKEYYRCSKVPKRNKIWCEKRFIVFFPANSKDIILQDNSENHTHENINVTRKTKLSPEMVQFMLNEYANKTKTYDSLIRHINHARKTQNLFQDEMNPDYRQQTQINHWF